MDTFLLTSTSQIQCTHGAPAVLRTTNTVALTQQAPVLLETDVHFVTGCPFTIGLKYSPCVRITWSAGAGHVRIQGTPPLTRASVGQCLNAEGALQGVALIAATQVKAKGR